MSGTTSHYPPLAIRHRPPLRASSHAAEPRTVKGDVWALGAGAEQRNDALTGLMAPDFTLPDVDGMPHTLSALRGNPGSGP